MNLFKITCVSCAIYLSGCSTPETLAPNKPQETTPEKTIDVQNFSVDKEIHERIDEWPNKKLTYQQKQDELSNILKVSLDRYDSDKKGDKLKITLSNISIITDGYTYTAIPVIFTISRSGSRLINLKDIDFLKSGIQDKVRVTYSENRILYIDGIKQSQISLKANKGQELIRLHKHDIDTAFKLNYLL